MCFLESGTVSITGGGLTVEKEQRVEFQCLTSGWYPQPTIGWSLNGQPADSSQYNSSSAAVGDTFNSTSVLTFQAVSSTTVECWATVLALSRPKASQVFLAVGKERTSLLGQSLGTSQVHRCPTHKPVR